MTTPAQKNLVDSNSAYASGFDKGDLALPPAKQYAVGPAFGISLGDAHVIRNAGGSARAALRDLIISEQFLATKEILLVKHSDCGMLTFTNEAAHDHVGKQLGSEAASEIKGLDFLPFPNLDAAVKDDISFLKASKAIPDSIKISGWVYEVETGKVRAVE
ncbi:MAG: hypothetical protein M1837_002545 [Sclerophora amabilis]|nr:MAG: hypothetical protein M1837_002545 [Sclerophora amabilis]